jgi:hypothetical protein
MKASIGRVRAQLAEPLDQVSDELVELINQNVNPPDPVEPGDVHVRAMYVVSDQVNSFGGRFPADEHEKLAQLLIDSPVLVGHRKDRLPVGRTFHADVVSRDGNSWIKAYFYWLCSSRGADDLLANIDGGVYKECSIGFTFGLPECSICRRDIRQCDHEPHRVYARGDATVRCHFNYRRIERVLETSLVYRGAIPDTSVSRDLAQADGSPDDNPGGLNTEQPGEWALHYDADDDCARLVLQLDGRRRVWRLRQFHPSRLRQGARFVCDQVRLVEEVLRACPNCLRGRISAVNMREGSLIVGLSGGLDGSFVLQPVQLDGAERFLFYRLKEDPSSHRPG